jgi:hypothetical protein
MVLRSLSRCRSRSSTGRIVFQKPSVFKHGDPIRRSTPDHPVPSAGRAKRRVVLMRPNARLAIAVRRLARLTNIVRQGSRRNGRRACNLVKPGQSWADRLARVTCYAVARPRSASCLVICSRRTSKCIGSLAREAIIGPE